MISKNIKETEKIAHAFLEKLNPAQKGATVVGLYGDLGTGKTTFTQAVGKHLGIKRKVNSPTFVILKRYELQNKKGTGHKSFLADKTRAMPAGEKLYDQHLFGTLFHMDAYRLKNENELVHLGWEEIISNPKNLVFIEWPEQIIKAIPKKHHTIHITHTKEGYRKFKIKKG